MDTHSALHRAFDLSAVRGVTLIVLGMAAIAFPIVTSIITVYVVAGVLVLAGFTHLLFAVREARQQPTLWTGLIGAIYVLAGAALFGNPLWGVATIAIVLGVVLLIEGVLSLIVYFTAEQTSRWVLFNGVVTIVLAAIITSGWRSTSLWMIGMFAGINLVVRGIAALATWNEAEV